MIEHVKPTEVSMIQPNVHPLLPHAAPACPNRRVLLYGLRRMAAGGIGDAFAAQAFLCTYGEQFRRPLVLMRGLVAEIARVGRARLAIGPCCCPRMSHSEQALLHALSLAEHAPAQAHAAFAQLLQVQDCLSVTASAEALAMCLADLGRPLGGTAHDCM